MLNTRPQFQIGFTLIELSIVLVIIGLIVGGILVGRDLIAAAEIRAQISQIEKYNQAINAFRVKYNALPGDIAAADADSFGFAARGIYAGTGDGNGLIEGISAYSAGMNGGYIGASGESALVWNDLSAVQLIDGSFTTATGTSVLASTVSSTVIATYLPKAKIGSTNYISIESRLGANYFMLENTQALDHGSTYTYLDGTNYGGLTVRQAYSIDAKIDDGLPGTGSVIAAFQLYNTTTLWADWTGGGYGTLNMTIPTTAVAAANLSCYDNGSTAGQVPKYSINFNNGRGVNCPLSFKFQ